MPQPSPTFRSELAAQAIPLRSLARRLVGGEQADDLAQDTLVVALSTPASIPASMPSDQLGRWLRAVLRNEHRMQLRRTRRRRSREARSVDGDATLELDDPALTQILIALREVVETLDEPYRRAIVERILEDRSAADIARSEGCPAATVRWRVQEGLRQTRRRMDERCGGRQQWFGALIGFAELPPSPTAIAMNKGTQSMTKLALLKVLTGVAAIAATTTLVVTQAPTAIAEPARDTPQVAAAIAPTTAAKPSAPLFEREHPAVAAAQAQAIAAAPSGVDAAEECDQECEECGDPSQAPTPPWVQELTESGPVGDPMDAVKQLALPGKGTDDAKVSIVVCSDFDCPFCEKANATLDKIEQEYGERVSVHWLNMPLPSHPGAKAAAAAGIAADAQGKFWPMHDLLFAQPDARDEGELVALAKQLGLDTDRFLVDLRADSTQAAIADQQRTCVGNGAEGTPSFFINGDLLVGAQPYDRFAAIIDDELAQ